MWLHVPSNMLASAQGAEDSTSESSWPLQTLAASCTWRGKLVRPPSWRRLLRKATWTMRLSGLTSSPSILDRGAAEWIGSLAVSPASRTAPPASGWATPTNATSGPSLRDWYTTLRQRSSSWRTFQASFSTIGESYDPTYRPWATRLRRASSQRRRSARRIFGSGSSGWPTPDTAPDAPNSGSNKVNGPRTTQQAALLWATPDTGATGAKDATNRQGGPSLPAPATQQAGLPGSPSTLALNPRFVEALMGWPGGLTDLESSGMESSPWLPLMRYCLSRLGWE